MTSEAVHNLVFQNSAFLMVATKVQTFYRTLTVQRLFQKNCTIKQSRQRLKLTCIVERTPDATLLIWKEKTADLSDHFFYVVKNCLIQHYSFKRNWKKKTQLYDTCANVIKTRMLSSRNFPYVQWRGTAVDNS